MSKTRWWYSLWLLVAAVSLRPAAGAELKTLPGHVPGVVAHLNALDRLPAAHQMRLAIGVPLRDPAGLDAFLAQLYDPASPNYHQYLTPEEFADRFGPTAQDYEAVKEFARTNGLTVAGTYGNRLVLDVTGPAAAVEKALHITLRTYQHPTEGRKFFAPDTEPAVAADLPVADIQGLSDYVRPHPLFKKMDVSKIVSRNGSAPDGSGSYFGNDFRNAYVPGTTLTGAGQEVGLLQFDGFYAYDIATYAAAAGGGRANIPIQTVSVDGYNGTPSSGNIEVSLDIEMAMSMAPGLAKIVVFEADPNTGIPNDVLNAMVTYSNSVKNLSCSWGWSGGPSTTTDNIFKNMQAGGQTFFNASGDSDAFTTGASSVNGADNPSLDNVPSSSAYITEVGGTTLTMNGTGASYSSETVWNWGYDSNAGGYVGSSGGISSYYSMPSWQASVSNMAGRGGSASFRNTPDVALTADNVYVVYGGNGSGSGGIGGTSCAAPLWAGFMALVNQQAVASGRGSVGFINPAIYTIAAGANYSACFHDVTTGNNTWSSSPNLFYAQTGYDLCTGLGTPNGAGLIAALAGPVDALGISLPAGFSFTGPYGGPFSPGSGVFQLTNASGTSINWSLNNTSVWLQASSSSGSLAANGTASVSFSLTAAAGSLALGSYTGTVAFTNLNSHVVQSLPLTLQVYQPMSVSPIKGFAVAGPVGGPFVGASQVFTLTNVGSGTVSWSMINTSSWLTVSAKGSSLAPDGSASVTASLAASASALAAGTYNGSLIFSNTLGVIAGAPFTLSVGQPLVQNGGFETGDFTGWTISGNNQYMQVTAGNPYYEHSGSYGAQVGPSSTLGYLGQQLTTVPGQNYLLSLWLRNADGGTPNQFQVLWNGATIFSQANFISAGWTNLQFLVTATSSSTSLQIGVRNDPYYFGLDDISVTALAQAVKSTLRSANNFQMVLNTSTGLVYQLQYKTSLLQTNWANTGNPVTASAGTLTLTDTNAFKSSPQRYYRVSISP